MDIFKHTQKQNNKMKPILWLPTTQVQPDAVLYARDIQSPTKSLFLPLGKCKGAGETVTSENIN